MVGWEKPLLAVLLLGKPTVGWEKPMLAVVFIGKPMAILGKTYFGSFMVGHHLVGLVVHHLVFFGKTRNLAGKKSFRKTHGWMGKTFVS